MRDKVFLIGMPGAGKTTLGMQLAQELEYAFFDLDYEIEREEGKTVSQIFKAAGESHFRELEHQKLLHFIEDEPKSFVLATGGGTPCFYSNLQLMLEAGEVIHVFTEIQSLAKRLKRRAGSRPLLQGKNIIETVNATWEARKEYYEKAHHQYNPVEQLLPEFLESIAKKKASE